MSKKSDDEIELNRREKMFVDLYSGCVERFIRSLFILNTGGLASVLAYIYHYEDVCSTIVFNCAITSFFIGILFAFSLVILDLSFTLNAFEKFMEKKSKGEISAEDARRRSNNHFSKILLKIFGILSSVCFLIGCLFSYVGFLMK